MSDEILLYSYENVVHDEISYEETRCCVCVAKKERISLRFSQPPTK